MYWLWPDRVQLLHRGSPCLDWMCWWRLWKACGCATNEEHSLALAQANVATVRTARSIFQSVPVVIIFSATTVRKVRGSVLHVKRPSVPVQSALDGPNNAEHVMAWFAQIVAKLNSAVDAAWLIIDWSTVALARPVTVVLVDTKSVANCVTPLATRDLSVETRIQIPNGQSTLLYLTS